MKKAMYFINYTERDFEWKFNNELYKFPAGCKMMLDADVAQHFAKHLVDREMTRDGIDTDKEVERSQYLEKCLRSTDVEAESGNKLNVAMMNAEKDDKVEENNESASETKEALIAKAKSMGIDADKRWGESKLKKAIAEKSDPESEFEGV